jgi:hypothetical protein
MPAALCRPVVFRDSRSTIGASFIQPAIHPRNSPKSQSMQFEQGDFRIIIFAMIDDDCSAAAKPSATVPGVWTGSGEE